MMSMGSIVDDIDSLCAMDFDLALKDFRISKVSIELLQQMAVHLHIPKVQKKRELIAAIREKMRLKKELAVHLAANENLNDGLNSSSVAGERSADSDQHPYRANANTFPRLLNFLMKHPDKVARMELLSTRMELQAKSTKANNVTFLRCLAQFNDPSQNSGGLINEDFEFKTRDIDPENTGLTNIADFEPDPAFKLFKQVRADYSKAMINFQASGKHNGADFFNYCKSDVNVLYLYYHLEQSQCPDIKEFMRAGAVIELGLDSAKPLSTSSMVSPEGAIPVEPTRAEKDKAKNAEEAKKRDARHLEEHEHSKRALIAHERDSVLDTLNKSFTAIEALEEAIENEQLKYDYNPDALSKSYLRKVSQLEQVTRVYEKAQSEMEKFT